MLATVAAKHVCTPNFFYSLRHVEFVRELNFELIKLNLIMCNNYAIDSICYVKLCV